MVDRFVERVRDALDGTGLVFDLLETCASSCPQTLPCGINAFQESRIILQTVVEPVVFRAKAYQYASRLPVSCDENFLFFGKA